MRPDQMLMGRTVSDTLEGTFTLSQEWSSYSLPKYFWGLLLLPQSPVPKYP